MIDPWPFDQPPDCAVITSRDIIEHSAPILHVTHDIEDHGWQFLGPAGPDIENAAVVSLSEILELDPTVSELATMAPGYEAWREGRDQPWMQKPSLTDEHK